MTAYLLAGGSGLIGSRLTELLLRRGARVKHLSRSPKPIDGVETFRWSITEQTMDDEALDEVDVIVHLAGAEVMDQRLTDARKKELLDSRVDGLRLLRETIAKREAPIRTLISSSAQGYYEPNLGRELQEGEEAGAGWMGQLCMHWEAEALRWQPLGIRVVINRIGLVLSASGGALPMMLPPIRKGFAPHFGGGRQIYPWIHIDDMCAMIIHEVDDDSIEGALNAAAPSPVDQREMNRAIAASLGRKVIALGVPRFIPALFMGERAALLADSWHLSAEKITEAGFVFTFPHLDEALDDLLGS